MLKTIGGLARETGYAPHQIRFVLKSREIQPTFRLGTLGAFVFDEGTVTRILQELDRIAVRRIPVASAQKKSRGRRVEVV